MNIKNILLCGALICALSHSGALAQEQIVIEPLFEYPSAPEEMEGLQERSEYLLEHFWDPMDFKDKTTVDQNALNDAFNVYVAPMRFADASKVDVSVSNVISKIAKNPALSLQFAKAAEEALYGPRAYYWNDEIFIRFLDNVIANKQIKKDRKARYQRLRTLLGNTLQGSMPPEFDYKTPEGKTSHYHPNGVITIIEFGDPDCDDCRMAKLKMDTNITLSDLIDKGKVNVLFINADPEEGWEEKLSSYPAKWHVGASDEVGDLYDLRGPSPTIYVIDREGKIAAKNISVETALQIATAAAQQ